MTYARRKTQLSLNRWAQVMGFNVWAFNSIQFNRCNLTKSCNGLWYQNPSQSNYLTREVLAQGILQAEAMIESHVNFSLTYKNQTDKIAKTFPYTDSCYRDIQLETRCIVAPGHLKLELLAENLQLSFEDRDGDGFTEWAIFEYGGLIDPEYICAFYPGSDNEICGAEYIGDGRWEIPLYDIVRQEVSESLCPGECIIGEEMDNYLTSIDLKYYVKDEDVCDVLVKLNTKPMFGSSSACGCKSSCKVCTECVCFSIENEELGWVSMPHYPKARYQFNYISGESFRHIDPCWELPIAYLALSYVNESECVSCCDVNSDLASKWAVPLDYAPRDYSRFTTPIIIENMYGTATKGAWFAYRVASTKCIP